MSSSQKLLQESTVYAFYVPALHAIKVGFGTDGRSRMLNYRRQYNLSASAISLREWKLPSPTLASSIEAACHRALLQSDFRRIAHLVDEREARELFELGPHSYEQAVILVAEAIEETVNSLYEALGRLQPLSQERARQQKQDAQRRRDAVRAEKQKIKEQEESRLVALALPDIQRFWKTEVQPFVVACQSARKLYKQFEYRQGILSSLWAGKQSAAIRLKASHLYPAIKPFIPQIFHTGRRAKGFYCQMEQRYGEYAERAAKQLGCSLWQPGDNCLPMVGTYDDSRGMPFLEVRLVVQEATGFGGDDAIELMALDPELLALVGVAAAISAPELKSRKVS